MRRTKLDKTTQDAKTGETQNVQDIHKYDAIIDLPHRQSPTRPHMSMDERAAQFAPFATLHGYDAAIREAEEDN